MIIEEKRKSLRTDWDTAYITEYLERLLLQDNVLPTLDVVFMQEGNLRIRALDSNGKIDELMQGPNPHYPGDRNIHNDRAQLQVHYIQCQMGGVDTIKTTALAIYIPNQPEFNLSFIVRGGE